MTDTWKNDGVRIEELEGRVREFERLIAVVGETAMAMAEQLRQALLVTIAIPETQTAIPETLTVNEVREGIRLLLERATERDEAVAHARRWENKAEEYRANAIRFGDERDALRARIAELEQDRDQWRKRVEMEDAEIMGIIGVNDRG